MFILLFIEKYLGNQNWHRREDTFGTFIFKSAGTHKAF